MTVLETSIRGLADALNELEAKIEDNAQAGADSGERRLAAIRHRRAARTQIEAATQDVAALISEIQSLLDAGDVEANEKAADSNRAGKKVANQGS